MNAHRYITIASIATVIACGGAPDPDPGLQRPQEEADAASEAALTPPGPEFRAACAVTDDAGAVHNVQCSGFPTASWDYDLPGDAGLLVPCTESVICRADRCTIVDGPFTGLSGLAVNCP